jgi:hypothetical protein
MKPTLEERCAELKARMLAKQSSRATTVVIARATATSDHRPLLKTTPDPVETPAVSLANPHPLVRAALSGTKDVGEDYGKLQFRRGGLLDIRVSSSSVRRALKIMDSLIKKLERGGLKVRIESRERGYYQSFHRETYATDEHERVQITVMEKTYRRDNPSWNEEKRYSVDWYHHHPSGILTLSLDESSYWKLGCRHTWSDGRGHLIEQYLDDADSSIRQALQLKREDRVKAEQERHREVERQRLRAEAQRQDDEESKRIEQLKCWEQAWTECERLRAFVAEWERQAQAESDQIESGSAADGWRRWAHLTIDRLDPFRE